MNAFALLWFDLGTVCSRSQGRRLARNFGHQEIYADDILDFLGRTLVTAQDEDIDGKIPIKKFSRS